MLGVLEGIIPDRVPSFELLIDPAVRKQLYPDLDFYDLIFVDDSEVRNFTPKLVYVDAKNTITEIKRAVEAMPL